MQAFKSKTFRRILSAIVLIVFCVSGYIGVSYCLENVTYASYANKDVDDILESGEDVQLLIVGASRMYHSMVPDVLEDKLGLENVFVASTATQLMGGSYYYLEDMLRKFNPKTVAIDVTWDRLLNEFSVQPSLLVYDRLSPLGKARYVSDCFELSDYKYLLKPVRYKDNISNVREVLNEKKQLIENDYNEYSEQDDYYLRNGYIYAYNSNENGGVYINYQDDYSFSEDRIIQENVEYLDRCIELCRKKGIEVTLLSGPCSLAYVYYVEGYDDAVNWYKRYAEEKGVTYYNLNYIKDRDELVKDDFIYDECHVNAQGARVFSEIYAEVLKRIENGEDASELFYDSLAELKADVHRVVNVCADISIEEPSNTNGMYSSHFCFNSLANDEVEVFYQVELENEAGERTIIVPWTAESEADVLLEATDNMKLIVMARDSKESDDIATHTYTY